MLTIPALIGNIRDIQFRSQFFKSYALIQQTLKKMEAEDALIPPVYTDADRKNNPFYKQFNAYLVNTVDCGDYYSTSNKNLCFDFKTDSYTVFVGNSTYNPSWLDDGQILFTGGTLLHFDQPDGPAEHRIWIYVDVNGVKLPNRPGHDLFVFQLTDDGLKPMGAEGTSYDEETYCNKRGSGNLNGISCAVKVLKNPQYFKWIKRVGD